MKLKNDFMFKHCIHFFSETKVKEDRNDRYPEYNNYNLIFLSISKFYIFFF